MFYNLAPGKTGYATVRDSPTRTRFPGAIPQLMAACGAIELENDKFKII